MAGLAISSGLINATAGQLIHVGKGVLSGVSVITDSVNVATLTVYDNALGDTSGTVLARISATATTGANSLAMVTPIRADLGISVVVSGTGAPQAVLYYGA
jgi:hypothetical protein